MLLFLNSLCNYKGSNLLPSSQYLPPKHCFEKQKVFTPVTIYLPLPGGGGGALNVCAFLELMNFCWYTSSQFING